MFYFFLNLHMRQLIKLAANKVKSLGTNIGLAVLALVALVLPGVGLAASGDAAIAALQGSMSVSEQTLTNVGTGGAAIVQMALFTFQALIIFVLVLAALQFGLARIKGLWYRMTSIG